MKKVLITGADGFIGGKLATFLPSYRLTVIRSGTKVKEIADNKSSSPYFTGRLPSKKFIDFVAIVKPQIIIHCAGTPTVKLSINDPLQDVQNNVESTECVFEAALTLKKSPHIIFLSSAAIYGETGSVPVKEDFTPQPISPYGVTKLKAEELCRDYHQSKGLTIDVLRLSSVYGPTLRKQLFWDLYTKIQANDKIVLSGTGNQKRNFTHIQDVCQVISHFIRFEKMGFDITNVSNGLASTILEASLIFLSNLKVNRQLFFSGINVAGDPQNLLIDNGKLTHNFSLQWTNISDGLETYAEWLAKEANSIERN